MKPWDDMSIIDLKVFEFAVTQELNHLNMHIEVTPVVERTARGMVLQLRVFVAGSETNYEERLVVPADWWSHFKVWVRANQTRRWVRWFLPWVFRDFAGGLPRYTTHVFTAKGKILFPNIPTHFREQHRHHIRVSTLLKPEDR